MSSFLNRQGTGGQGRSGRSVRTIRPTLHQPMTYMLHCITGSFSSPTTYKLHPQRCSCLFRTSRPAHVFDDERKMVEAISKKQYSKFKENKSSLKDVLKLGESLGIDDTIRQFRSFLEIYDLLFLYTIVCSADSKLRKCTLKLRDGKPITYNLLTDYRSVTPKIFTLSTAWYNKYEYFTDSQNRKQTVGCDMS